MQGYLVTVEGMDFTGKSTLVKGLRDSLGEDVTGGVKYVREPGGTVFSEKVRELLLDPAQEMSDLAEALLYAAARAQLISELIVPALEAGKLVVCDRFIDSSIAYQGYGRGYPLTPVEVYKLNRLALDLLPKKMPHLTLLLHLPERERLIRAKEGRDPDRIEMAGTEFARKVAQGFLHLAAQDRERITILDATKKPAVLLEEAMTTIEEKLHIKLHGKNPITFTG